MKALFLIGRSLFGAFFLYSGIHHFQEMKMLSGYAGSKGVPASKVAVGATGALLIAGGTSILLGVKPKLGALAAVTFLGGVSPVMHDFWNTQDPNQRTQDMINFSKNMALMGGALALSAVREPWPLSVPVAQPSPASRLSSRIARLPKAA